MPNLKRTVQYKVNQEVEGLGKVIGRVIVHVNPDPNHKMTLSRLEFKADVQDINYHHIPDSDEFNGRLELWMNCDSELLEFNRDGNGFVDNDPYWTYFSFAYDCLKKVILQEKQR